MTNRLLPITQTHPAIAPLRVQNTQQPFQRESQRGSKNQTPKRSCHGPTLNAGESRGPQIHRWCKATRERDIRKAHTTKQRNDASPTKNPQSKGRNKDTTRYFFFPQKGSGSREDEEFPRRQRHEIRLPPSCRSAGKIAISMELRPRDGFFITSTPNPSARACRGTVGRD
jgi:hypothetical protein